MSKLPFTAKQVIEAFARHPEIQPLQGAFRTTTTKEGSPITIEACCGVSILLVEAGYSDVVAATTRWLNDVVVAYCLAMGWNRKVVSKDIRDFIDGFDIGEKLTGLEREYKSEAYAMGCQVANVVFAK